MNYQVAVGLLDTTLGDPQAHLDVKVMCALLKYKVRMSLEGLIRTKLISDVSSPLDIIYDGVCFRIAGTIQSVPEDFNVYLRTLNTDRVYLVTDSQGKPYLQSKYLNNACVLLFGQNYRTLQHIFLQNATSPHPVPVLSNPKPKPKPKFKFKLKVKKLNTTPDESQSQPPKTRPWADYNDPLIRESSNKIQHRNVQRLVYHLVGKDDMFYYGAFESLAAFDQIKTFLESPHAERGGKLYSLETRANFINALCKFLHNTSEFNAVLYDTYCHYRDELKAKNMVRVKPPVDEFTTFVPRLTAIVADKTKVPGFRIVCSMIVNNMNLADTDEETPGVLRMSDLLHTRFQDDREHSFIDLSTKKWYIKSKYTKNKKARTIVLPDNFIADIKNIYCTNVPEWLLIGKSGKPYETVDSLTNMFRDYMGVKFTDIRASYATYRHQCEVSTVGDMKKLCHTMGHSMNTVQNEYLRR